MYAITIDVPIDLATHFIDVIQKVIAKKEVSLPFDRLISRVATMVNVPLHDSEPTIKIYEKISVKKRSYPKEATSSQPKTPQTSSLLPLIIEQLQVLSYKFDSITSK
jgi:hypothetical protein